MRKAKIIATIGPASRSYGKISELITAGVNVFRLNFSHGDYSLFSKAVFNIKKAREKAGEPIAILQDLQGPKIRVSGLEKTMIVKRGDILEVKGQKLKVKSGAKTIAIDYNGLYKYVKPGNRILINDGMVSLRVEAVKDKTIICKVINGGEIADRKGVNLPGIKLPLSSLTNKDRKDLRFGLKKKVDIVSLSFVRTAADIIELKKLIGRGRNKPLVIAKIEKPEGVRNIDAILAEADGIMVARGDLAVEIGYSRIPGIQKTLIKKANALGKLVIVATQMLESMTYNPYPERAEITDVYNAVLDGADTLMLSGETSVGKYPVKTARVMADIIKKGEKEPAGIAVEKPFISTVENYENALSYAAVLMPSALPNAEIAVRTENIKDISYLSDYRPSRTVIAVTGDKALYYKLAIFNGILPVYMPGVAEVKIAAYLKKKLRNIENIIYIDYHPDGKTKGKISVIKAG